MIRKKKWHMLAALLWCLSIIINGCVVLYHDDPNGINTKPEHLGSRTYDSEAFVQEIWETEFLPYLRENAVEISVLLEAFENDRDQAVKDYGSRAKGALDEEAFIVKGSATLINVNKESSAGFLEMDANGDGQADFSIQIGPIIKTTALRDCVPFIRFDMFADQMEYASISKELNNKALKEVIGETDFESLVGKSLTFLGAFNYSETDPNRILVIPVELGGI